MTRIIVDTNIWISLLLGPSDHSTISQAATAAFSIDVELIVPQELIEELRTAFANSSYLTNRISEAEVDVLIE